MQTSSEGPAEITLMWDESQYRAMFRAIVRRERWRQIWGAGVAILIFLGGLWYLDVDYKFLLIGLVVSTAVVAWDLLRAERKWMSRLGEWCFSPITYRVDADGLSVHGVLGDHSLRWCGVAKVEKLPDFWCVRDINGMGEMIPRSALPAADDEALAAAFSHYAGRVGEAWQGTAELTTKVAPGHPS